jgi:hypothetical protein
MEDRVRMRVRVRVRMRMRMICISTCAILQRGTRGDKGRAIVLQYTSNISPRN